jgi:hypothetical protein
LVVDTARAAAGRSVAAVAAWAAVAAGWMATVFQCVEDQHPNHGK